MTTIQDVAEQAAADPKVGRLVSTSIAAFNSPDPAASFAWLAEVEQDPDLQSAYSYAAKLVLARKGGDRD